MLMNYRAGLIAIAAAGVLAACGGSSSGPVYDYMAAPGPLRYEITQTNSTIVETPGGDQASDQAMTAVVVLALGSPVEGGRAVTATFESMDLLVGSPMGEQTIDGSEIVGKSFVGVLHTNGSISITEAPVLEGELSDLFDASDLLGDLLAPMPPPGAETTVSWPHVYGASRSTVMEFVSTYDGTATFAGDSTWNGQATRVIVSKGDLAIAAIGTPEGAPGEVEMNVEGPSETTYLWDPATGVMRAASSTAETEGEIMTMGFTLRAVTMIESTVLLSEGND